MANPEYIRYRRHPETMTKDDLSAAEETEASIAPVLGGHLLRGLFSAVS